MRSWPVMPGVPAAGHVTTRGFWHPGRAEGCTKCEPPRANLPEKRVQPRHLK